MSEIALGVVTHQSIDAQSVALHTNLNATEAPVLHGVGAAVSDQVIGRSVALHAPEGVAEIIGVRECLSTGVAGQRDKRVLRRRESIELLGHAAAVEQGDAAAAGLAGIPAG